MGNLFFFFFTLRPVPRSVAVISALSCLVRRTTRQLLYAPRRRIRYDVLVLLAFCGVSIRQRPTFFAAPCLSILSVEALPLWVHFLSAIPFGTNGTCS